VSTSAARSVSSATACGETKATFHPLSQWLLDAMFILYRYRRVSCGFVRNILLKFAGCCIGWLCFVNKDWIEVNDAIKDDGFGDGAGSLLFWRGFDERASDVDSEPSIRHSDDCPFDPVERRTLNFLGCAVGRSIVPMSQLYVAISFEAASGKVGLRFRSWVLQSMTLPNSTRLPASPAARLMV
jgi:hypothetical protein